MGEAVSASARCICCGGDHQRGDCAATDDEVRQHLRLVGMSVRQAQRRQACPLCGHPGGSDLDAWCNECFAIAMDVACRNRGLGSTED